MTSNVTVRHRNMPHYFHAVQYCPRLDIMLDSIDMKDLAVLILPVSDFHHCFFFNVLKHCSNMRL